MINRQFLVFGVLLLLILISLGTSFQAISITTTGGGSGSCPTTEAELETNLTDVSDVYTNNDFADNSANWNTAFGWGDHSSQNYFDKDTDYLADIQDVDTTGVADGKILKYSSGSSNWVISDDLTGSGSCPTTEAELEENLTDVSDVYTNNDFADNSANWNTAFGWGDHSIQNYFDLDIDDTDDISEGSSNFWCDLARIQAQCSNDFHNIGGTDDDVPESGDFGNGGDLNADGTITDGVIDEADLDITNSPTDEYVLTYESTGTKFEWLDPSNWNNAYTWSNALYNTIGLSALTSSEVDQLENIGLSTISSAQWGYLSNLDQDVHRTSDPTFDDLTIDDLECQDISVNEGSGDASIKIYPTTNNDADIFWYANGDTNYWRYYVNEGSQFNFMLDFYGGAIVGTLNTLYSKYISGIPGYMAWGFAGETNPSYGTTLQNTVGNAGNDRAYVHSTYSDNRSKLFLGDLPKNKCLELYDYLQIQYYYHINHTYNEDGDLEFNNNYDNRTYYIGVDAQDLYYWLVDNFNPKIAHSLVNVPNDENKEFWGVDYDAINLIIIQALRYKSDDLETKVNENIEHTKDIENFLSSHGYDPLPWD